MVLKVLQRQDLLSDTKLGGGHIPRVYMPQCTHWELWVICTDMAVRMEKNWGCGSFSE